MDELAVIEDDNVLNPKQEIFCQEYVIHWNATKAALKAGYSEQTAPQIGYENLQKPKLKKRIEEIKNNILDEIGITQAKVYRELGRLAFFDISDAYDDNGNLKHIKSMKKDVSAALTSLKTYEEISYDENGKKNKIGEIKEVKFANKIDALDKIIRIAGWNAPEKLNIDANIAARPINFE